MGIDKFNAEGYFDPTVYEALTVIEKEEKGNKNISSYSLYLLPFAGDIQRNIESARRYSRFAIVMGCIPIAPHLLFPQFLDDSDPEERKTLAYSLAMYLCPNVLKYGFW